MRFATCFCGTLEGNPITCFILVHYICFPPEVIFRSRVIGACPVTTDCIAAMSLCENNNNNTHRQTDQIMAPCAHPGMKSFFCLKAKIGLGRFAPSALPHYKGPQISVHRVRPLWGTWSLKVDETLNKHLCCNPHKRNIFLLNLRSNRQLKPPLPLIFFLWDIP